MDNIVLIGQRIVGHELEKAQQMGDDENLQEDQNIFQVRSSACFDGKGGYVAEASQKILEEASIVGGESSR